MVRHFIVFALLLVVGWTSGMRSANAGCSYHEFSGLTVLVSSHSLSKMSESEILESRKKSLEFTMPCRGPLCNSDHEKSEPDPLAPYLIVRPYKFFALSCGGIEPVREHGLDDAVQTSQCELCDGFPQSIFRPPVVL